MAFAFAAAVMVTTLALALSAYFITRATQNEDALNKALTQARFNLFLADSLLPAEPQEADYNRLLEAFQLRGDFATLIRTGSETYVSGPQVTEDLVTAGLTAKAEEGRIGYQTVEMGGERTVAVGGQVRSTNLSIYFFFPQGAHLADLAALRNSLIIAGVILAVFGALAGYLLAQRLLRPLGRAGKAATLMAEGDLDTRLPPSQDEFGILAISFNRMAENLQAKMLDLEAGQARERRFVADVAHELRTPVSALVGEASLLKARTESDSTGCPPEIARLAQMVGTDIGRLRQLVDDLLEISRLEAQSADIFLEPVRLEDLLSRLVTAYGWSTKVQIESDRSDGYVINTDKRRLERIMVNLLENALYHGTPPVVVGVHSRQEHPGEANLVEICIDDHGAGIPQQDLPHIFDRFYKADPSRSSSRGSGLGLAIARQNARLLRGDLTAANLPAGGARFTLVLPNAVL